MDKPLLLSIVIPTLNEEGNIPKLVERIDRALRFADISYEIIFIDDYSTDNTREVIYDLAGEYPISIYLKKGPRGKAYSLLEGFSYALGNLIAIIDADLQYPPEALPKMVEKINQGRDIVVAKRVEQSVSLFRKILHWGFSLFFTKILHGFNLDVQAGLKVFKAAVAREVRFKPSSWTFDLEFLLCARNYGYTIGSVDIDFVKRYAGETKINFVGAIWECGFNAVKLRFKKRQPLIIQPELPLSMMGAGIAHKRKRFITHTNLDKNVSAFQTFVPWQRNGLLLVLGVFLASLVTHPLGTGIAVMAILSTFYFIDAIFNFYLVARSLKDPPEIKSTLKELTAIDESVLPIYSILCPLYKEANILPTFVAGINKIDWPKNKLDVLLLLEENDRETVAAAQALNLPDYFRIIVVPHSLPKTKPKACNFGLSLARGEYIVIYDAEDAPDPEQLKKAYLGFKKSPAEVRCLQAKLNYYNPHQNLLTRLFTAEYSLWFDVTLPGLQSINTTIPLGGTSNHFRAKDLLELQGWDPFNVTEDCDLGVRIFRQGFKTAIIDSVTLEEANSNIKNWLRQRSRWVKGYIQTYLVTMRNPIAFIRQNRIHAFIFQMVVGAKIAFMIINPIMWMATISYFVLNSLVGPTIESLYPAVIFYPAVASLIFGNFSYLYYYMIGCAKREHWLVIKYVFFVPVYWFLMSTAAAIATYQLFIKPHFWEKTHHGLHLKPVPRLVPPIIAPQLLPQPAFSLNSAFNFSLPLSFKLPVSFKPATILKSVLNIKPFLVLRSGFRLGSAYNFKSAFASKFSIIINKFPKLAPWSKLVLSAEGFFITALLISNFINFVFNAFLGRVLSFEILGLVILVNTIWYIATIFITAFSTTVNHRIAYFFGLNKRETGRAWLSSAIVNGLKVVIPLSVLWLIAVPALSRFFNIADYMVLLLVTPIFPLALIGYANVGYLKGTFRFAAAAIIMLAESFFKLALAAMLVYWGSPGWVFVAIPASVVIASLISTLLIRQNIFTLKTVKKFVFPKRFFTSSLMANLSSMAFLSLDIILVKHFLSPSLAGEYALLSLIGKMIFFSGTLPNMFMITFVSRNEGLKRDSRYVLNRIFLIALIIVMGGVVGLGIFGRMIVPFLLGEKTLTIIPYLLTYTVAMALFTLSYVIVSYQLARKRYYYTTVSLAFSLLMAVGIIISHASLASIVFVVFLASLSQFLSVGALHLLGDWMKIIKRNLKDFLGVFGWRLLPGLLAEPDKKNVLIFNWRDMRHKFAGGAELYIQEMAKRWVKQGNRVTIFCGNDGFSPRNETTDGVEIVRRGGFYFVYVWAFLYYLLHFRGKYDVIIDCENGIPFFTPLYAKEPVYCLMHHVHQEVFRISLAKPLAWLASFLEKVLMPIVYRNTQFITVSESSKRGIRELGLGKAGLEVINPGVDLDSLAKGTKSQSPMVLYFGRLKAYKSIDVLLEAFKIVIDRVPNAKLVIAGSGEEESNLKRLTREMQLDPYVTFAGRVTEEEKKSLLQRAWMAVNPSFMEGWGITTIEANACGTPVVASNVPGLQDSVCNPHTGHLVPYGDVESFAERIIQLLLDDNKREEMSQAAITWAKRFDWDASSCQFFSFISNGYHKRDLNINFLESYV